MVLIPDDEVGRPKLNHQIENDNSQLQGINLFPVDSDTMCPVNNDDSSNFTNSPNQLLSVKAVAISDVVVNDIVDEKTPASHETDDDDDERENPLTKLIDTDYDSINIRDESSVQSRTQPEALTSRFDRACSFRSKQPFLRFCDSRATNCSKLGNGPPAATTAVVSINDENENDESSRHEVQPLLCVQDSSVDSCCITDFGCKADVRNSDDACDESILPDVVHSTRQRQCVAAGNDCCSDSSDLRSADTDDDLISEGSMTSHGSSFSSRTSGATGWLTNQTEVQTDDEGCFTTATSPLMNWQFLEDQLQRAIERENQRAVEREKVVRSLATAAESSDDDDFILGCRESEFDTFPAERFGNSFDTGVVTPETACHATGVTGRCLTSSRTPGGNRWRKHSVGVKKTSGKGCLSTSSSSGSLQLCYVNLDYGSVAAGLDSTFVNDDGLEQTIRSETPTTGLRSLLSWTNESTGTLQTMASSNSTHSDASSAIGSGSGLQHRESSPSSNASKALVDDFFAVQARLQAEARLALAQVRPMARMQRQLERTSDREISQAFSLFSGTGWLNGRSHADRCRLLQPMGVGQLATVINATIAAIKSLNNQLMKLLVERDTLFIVQDALLVDIEDLTRRGYENATRRRHRLMQLQHQPP